MNSAGLVDILVDEVLGLRGGPEVGGVSPVSPQQKRKKRLSAVVGELRRKRAEAGGLPNVSPLPKGGTRNVVSAETSDLPPVSPQTALGKRKIVIAETGDSHSVSPQKARRKRKIVIAETGDSPSVSPQKARGKRRKVEINCGQSPLALLSTVVPPFVPSSSLFCGTSPQVPTAFPSFPPRSCTVTSATLLCAGSPLPPSNRQTPLCLEPSRDKPFPPKPRSSTSKPSQVRGAIKWCLEPSSDKPFPPKPRSFTSKFSQVEPRQSLAEAQPSSSLFLINPAVPVVDLTVPAPAVEVVDLTGSLYILPLFF